MRSCMFLGCGHFKNGVGRGKMIDPDLYSHVPCSLIHSSQEVDAV